MSFLSRLWGHRATRADVAPPSPETVTSLFSMELAKELTNKQAYQEAIDYLEEHAFDHDVPQEARYLLGKLYRHIGELDQAELILQQCIEDEDFDAATALELAEIHFAKHALDTADFYAKKALSFDALDNKVLVLLAEIAHEAQRYADSLSYLEKCALDENAPDEKILTRLANAQLYSGQYEQSLETAERLINLSPGAEDGLAFCMYCSNLYLGNIDEARRLAENGVRRHPGDPGFMLGRGMFRLLTHDFANGWDDYRYRLQADPRLIRPFPFQEWQGEPLRDKVILVAAEQGIGDQIMFASCVTDLVGQGAKVILEATARLHPLFARSFDECQVVASDQKYNIDWANSLNDVDYYLHAGDLPFFFRRTIADFPTLNSYLRADSNMASDWRKNLSDQGNDSPIKIGFAWKGGTEFTRSYVRSLTPADMTPLFGIPNITWISLQFGATDEEYANLPPMHPSSKLLYYPDTGMDLDELAAMIDAVDIVITACNTNVHLAGALGKKTLVLTPYLPEWRYGLEQKMPWYSSVSLLRQHIAGNWSEPIKLACAHIESNR